MARGRGARRCGKWRPEAADGARISSGRGRPGAGRYGRPENDGEDLAGTLEGNRNKNRGSCSLERIKIAPVDRVFVLTGAGISAESGLPTFRASDGLWAGHRVEDVCTPEALEQNPALVWQFYSERREQGTKAKPNPGHIALAELEA